MTDQNFTDITVLLDRSGSMQSCFAGTVSGFDEFVATQKRDARGAVHLSLIQFDNQYERALSSVPVHDVGPLQFQPRGMTALYDAIGRAIRETGARYAALREGARPGKVLFVIITDGGENSSREFTGRAVNAMIEEHKTKYSWDFVFLGANQDAIATAAGLGIAATKAMNYFSTDNGTQSVFRAAGAYAARSSTAVDAAQLQSNAFTQAERNEVGDKTGTAR